MVPISMFLMRFIVHSPRKSTPPGSSLSWVSDLASRSHRPRRVPVRDPDVRPPLPDAALRAANADTDLRTVPPGRDEPLLALRQPPVCRLWLDEARVGALPRLGDDAVEPRLRLAGRGVELRLLWAVRPRLAPACRGVELRLPPDAAALRPPRDEDADPPDRLDWLPPPPRERAPPEDAAAGNQPAEPPPEERPLPPDRLGT